MSRLIIIFPVILAYCDTQQYGEILCDFLFFHMCIWHDSCFFVCLEFPFFPTTSYLSHALNIYYDGQHKSSPKKKSQLPPGGGLLCWPESPLWPNAIK